DRHRHSGNLYSNRAQVIAARKVDRLPVVAAEGEIGGRRCPVHDAAELLARFVHDPDAAGAAAIDVSLDIDLHAVRHARFGAAQIDEDPVGVLGEHAVREQIEGPDVTAARVVDVEDAFVRREGQPVGQHEVVDQQA